MSHLTYKPISLEGLLRNGGSITDAHIRAVVWMTITGLFPKGINAETRWIAKDIFERDDRFEAHKMAIMFRHLQSEGWTFDQWSSHASRGYRDGVHLKRDSAKAVLFPNGKAYQMDDGSGRFKWTEIGGAA